MAKKDSESQNVAMTQEAFDELNDELSHRKTAQRDAIAEEISEARALGDLRENHAYSVAMEKRERNESRISELEALLKDVDIVKQNGSSKLVTIGRTVKIKNTKTKKDRVVILAGTEETEAADPREGKLSIGSPLGQALHKSKVGETVSVETPIGEVQYEIVSIS